MQVARDAANILQCTGEPPTTRIGLPKMSVVLKLRNPGIWIFKHGGPFKVL